MTVVGDFQGPRRGADRAVLLAHGAGADRQAPALRAVADALADAGVPSLRFDYPYRAAGGRAPDRGPKLEAATREAVDALARRTGLGADRLVLGGRSMGGRIGSLVAAAPDDPVPALGLLMLGYPLHPVGKPERRRDEHFPRIRCPMLFVSGTRDSLAPQAELIRAAKKLRGRVSFDWIETGDHGFRPLKRSGTTLEAVLTHIGETCVTWVQGLDATTDDEDNTA